MSKSKDIRDDSVTSEEEVDGRIRHAGAGIGVFAGFAFAANASMGTGWLTLPYAFYKSGIAASILIMVFFAIASNMGKDYFVESLVRCEAIARATTDVGRDTDGELVEKPGQRQELQNETTKDIDLERSSKKAIVEPEYVLSDRKWELAQCGDILFGRIGCWFAGLEYVICIW